MEIKNAVIEKAEIVIEDHNLLSAWLFLGYDGGGQGFGGYALYLPKSFKHHSVKSVAGHFIFRILEIANVTRWDLLPGKTVRVKADHNKVYAIGHIIKDDWFDPAEDFKREES